MFEIFFRNILLTAFFLAVAFAIGFLILRIFKIRVPESYLGVFILVLTGLFSIVCAFALVVAKSITILSGFLIIALYFFYDRHRIQYPGFEKAHTISIRFLAARFLEMTSVGAVVITYRLAFITTGGYFVDPVYLDSVFYAKMSKYLLDTGIENATLDYIFLDATPGPYHYFDLWANSFLLWISGHNAVELVVFSTYTVGAILIYAGLVSILERYRKIDIIQKLLAVVLIFSSGLYLGNLISFPFIESTSVFTRHVVNYSKLFPIFSIVILLFHLHLDKQPRLFISVLLILPLINISTAPGAFVLAGIFVLTWLKADKRMAIEAAVKLMLVAIFIGFFYTMGKKAAPGPVFQITDYLETSFLRTVLNIVGGAAIQQAIIFAPLFLLPAIFFRQFGLYRLTQYLIPLVVYFAFIIPWSLFHRNPNSVQLFSNAFVPFAGYFAIFIVLHLTTKKNSSAFQKITGTIILLSFPLAAIYNDINERISLRPFFSSGPSKELITFFNTVKNPVGVYFSDRYDWASKSTVFASSDIFFQQFVDRPKFHSISLSVFEIPIDTGIHKVFEQKMIESSIFWKFAHASPDFDRSDISKYQRQFIEQYNVDYIITSIGYPLPDDVKMLVKSEFTDTDHQIQIFSVRSK
jgi:hypothetical protein